MGQMFANCCQKGANASAAPTFDDARPLLSQRTLNNQLGFDDFKGFKKIDNIHDFYEFSSKLGSGSFGEVMKAEHIKANVDCAVKIIPKAKI